MHCGTASLILQGCRKMFDRRHLHPAAALIMAVRAIRQFIFPFIVLLVTQIGNLGLTGWLKWAVWAVVALVLLAATWGILSWRRFTYRVEDGELRIEHGVLIRSRRFIPQERIHSIDLVESVLHRIFGVVSVRVETAGGGEPEGLLAAVSRTDAEELRRLLNEKYVAVNAEDVDRDSTTFVRRITNRELLIAGATSGSIGIAFSLAGGAVSLIDDLLPNIDVFAQIDRFVGSGTTATVIGTMALIALIIAWLVAIIFTVVTYGRFQIKRIGNDLVIERGLLERRRSTIPLARIQAIRMVEGILRQPFGFATLHVESAGYGKEDGESTVLFPLLRKQEVDQFIHETVPEFARTEAELKRLPQRARPRAIIRLLIPVTVVAAAVSVFFFPWGLLSLVLFPLAVTYGWLRYRDAGWFVTCDRVVMRWRGLARTTAIVTKRRIQSSGISQSLFQRRKNLATFWVQVASGSTGAKFNMTDMDEQESEACFEWASLSHK